MLYGEQTWPRLRELAQQDKIVVMPIGSLEQHGHHLPLLTDSMIGSEIACRAEAELGDAALFLPMLWVGSSHHHLPFATVSLNASLYVEVIKEMVESVMAAGFNRIFVLNAHGGNEVPASLALQQLQLKHYKDRPNLWLTFSSWFGGVIGDEMSKIESLEQKFVTHACEVETSVILRVHPQLVKMELAYGAHYAYPSEFYTPDYSGPQRVSAFRSFAQFTQDGALGHPERATAEKGEQIIAMATREIVKFVREFATWQPLQPN
jgi:creatinine amidohydrolase